MNRVADRTVMCVRTAMIRNGVRNHPPGSGVRAKIASYFVAVESTWMSVRKSRRTFVAVESTCLNTVLIRGLDGVLF